VLIHGLGGERSVWRPVRARLERERDVIALDLPGFGDSPPLPAGADHSPRGIAAIVAEWLGAEGLAPAHLAGNSLGAWVAFELALAGCARSVAGVGTAGLWGGPLEPNGAAAHRAARRLLPFLRLAARTAAGRRRLLGGVVGDPDRVPPADAVRLVTAYARAPGFVATNEAMRAGHFTALADVPVPVTLIACERDRLVRPPRRTPPGVRVVRLERCGHIPMWDDPDGLAEALLAASAEC
jgi:pimeloyl-ACP methyl ester carboxylesterase